MTKAEIKSNNEKVLSLLGDFIDQWEHITPEPPVKFHSCQASTQYGRIDANSDMTILISYSTPVAVVYRDKLLKRCICIDYLRYAYCYTATSAQHINKFFHDFAYVYANCYSYEIIKYRYETVKG